MAIMLITHAMGVVAETAQRVVVMYAGKVIEEAARRAALQPAAPPLHAGPDPLDPAHRHGGDPQDCGSRPSPASVPSLSIRPPGCRFAPRCRFAAPVCREAMPPLREVAAGHKVACVLCGGAERNDRAAAARQGSGEELRGQGRAVRARGRPRSMPSTMSASTSPPARRSASSANRAAASRRPGAASCA